MKAFGLRSMTCSRCVNAVTTALNSADPGAKVEVDLPNHKALLARWSRQTRARCPGLRSRCQDLSDRKPVAPVLSAVWSYLVFPGCLCWLARRETVHRADASNCHDGDLSLQSFDLSNAELRKTARKS